MSQPPPPDTTPAPSNPFTLLMSPAARAPAPTTSPAPSTSSSSPPSQTPPSSSKADSDADAEEPDHGFPIPKFRLEVRDLAHAGAPIFLDVVRLPALMTAATRRLLRLLYASPSCAFTSVPPTRSVTLVLRDMPGVAYTTGSDLDNDHKEIHISLGYVARISPPARRADEIRGVVTHELVHCFQWNALGSCPGGLIEGVADWVRLRCDLAPPHWRREADGDSGWDSGYQRTAYFLDYLEGRFGDGTVRALNEKLRSRKYEAKPFWTELVGRPVEQLWEDYKRQLKGNDDASARKGHTGGKENIKPSTS